MLKHKKNVVEEKANPFLPVYINKTKLLDVNSILLDGYSEFSEETLETEKTEKSNKKAGLGFSIYKVNGSVEASDSKNNNNRTKISLKRVQTNSSLLSNTILILNKRGFLNNESLRIGDFIEVVGIFKNNSISDLLDQIHEMMSFAELASKLDKNNGDKNLKNTKDQIGKMKNALKKQNDTERELVYKTKDCIYVIHLSTEYIYESSIENIYNNELTYFGQVKEITSNYNFFADTPISRFNDDLVTDFTNAIESMVNNGAYKVNFELLKSSNNIKTIELDIIAIYRKCK